MSADHSHSHDSHSHGPSDTIAREQVARVVAYLGARKAAETLVAAIILGLQDAARALRDVATDDRALGVEFDPEVAFTISAFADDVRRFEERLGLAPDDDGDGDAAVGERQVLRRLGFTLDWLPDLE